MIKGDFLSALYPDIASVQNAAGRAVRRKDVYHAAHGDSEKKEFFDRITGFTLLR